MSAETKLKELNIQLPAAPAPAAAYVTCVVSGNLVFLAGHLPVGYDGKRVTGTVGADLTVDQGYEAARLTALNILATLRTNLGSLDRIRRVVKVTGMVQAAPGFTEHSRVVNGCSDLLFQVLGEAGRHARSAVGMASLPFGAAVEIEAIVEVS